MWDRFKSARKGHSSWRLRPSHNAVIDRLEIILKSTTSGKVTLYAEWEEFRSVTSTATLSILSRTNQDSESTITAKLTLDDRKRFIIMNWRLFPWLDRTEGTVCIFHEGHADRRTTLPESRYDTVNELRIMWACLAGSVRALQYHRSLPFKGTIGKRFTGTDTGNDDFKRRRAFRRFIPLSITSQWVAFLDSI